MDGELDIIRKLPARLYISKRYDGDALDGWMDRLRIEWGLECYILIQWGLWSKWISACSLHLRSTKQSTTMYVSHSFSSIRKLYLGALIHFRFARVSFSVFCLPCLSGWLCPEGRYVQCMVGVWWLAGWLAEKRAAPLSVSRSLLVARSTRYTKIGGDATTTKVV